MSKKAVTPKQQQARRKRIEMLKRKIGTGKYKVEPIELVKALYTGR
jgi:anti-sigma28 factor (negative regulator of flagellin synthesis)